MSRVARSFMELILSNVVWPGDSESDAASHSKNESSTPANGNGRTNVLSDAPASVSS
jgi:hypothetical protein